MDREQQAMVREIVGQLGRALAQLGGSMAAMHDVLQTSSQYPNLCRAYNAVCDANDYVVEAYSVLANTPDKPPEVPRWAVPDGADPRKRRTDT